MRRIKVVDEADVDAQDNEDENRSVLNISRKPSMCSGIAEQQGDDVEQSSLITAASFDYAERHNITHKEMMALIPLVKIDAYERYLLMCNFTANFSEKWNELLAFLLIVSLASGGYAGQALSEGSTRWEYVLTVFGSLFFFTYVVVSLAHANEFVRMCFNIFSNSTPDNFGILGSKEDWTSFTGENNMYWTILGLPVTIAVAKTSIYTLITVVPLVLAYVASL